MGRIIGLDYGEKRIGVALSDEQHLLAVAKDVILNEGMEGVMSYLRRLLGEYDVDVVVLGLPLGLDGEPTIQTDKVREVGMLIGRELEVEVDYQDERFSTHQIVPSLRVEKKKHRENKANRDLSSAVVILQAYLDGLEKKW